MSFMKCFDVVTMVTDEATRQFSPSFRENEERKQILEQYCDAIDRLAEEFGGQAFDVDIDETRMTISIRMDCSDIVIQSKDHLFYQLAARALAVRFACVNEDMIGVTFTFPSIWERSV